MLACCNDVIWQTGSNPNIINKAGKEIGVALIYFIYEQFIKLKKLGKLVL